MMVWYLRIYSVVLGTFASVKSVAAAGMNRGLRIAQDSEHQPTSPSVELPDRTGTRDHLAHAFLQNDHKFGLSLDLHNFAQSLDPGAERLEELCTTLPELLRSFALRIGYKAPSQMHYDVMAFVYNNRR
ncbi:hypothetical protein BJ166DRAFT_493098 [Pestalotiopsis sp. NC0098]|nr:hypothetical protein BJ166DRAFT_493098 [Pestalotiopsis sp. NC0098]